MLENKYFINQEVYVNNQQVTVKQIIYKEPELQYGIQYPSGAFLWKNESELSDISPCKYKTGDIIQWRNHSVLYTAVIKNVHKSRSLVGYHVHLTHVPHSPVLPFSSFYSSEENPLNFDIIGSIS